MTTKLNLTIDNKTVKRIKAYAAKRKISVSDLTEEYYNDLLNKTADSSFKSFLDKYAGSIKAKKPINVKKAKADYLKKKYA